MCAILDANCLNEVFGDGNRPEAGKKFYEWLESHGKLVIGGKLKKELGKSRRFAMWNRQAILAGRVKSVNDISVIEKTEQLVTEKSCQSDDQHIIALAQLSKARLLYSKDTDLHKDFQDPILISKPRGKVYSTLKSADFSAVHRQLLENRNLCHD